MKKIAALLVLSCFLLVLIPSFVAAQTDKDALVQKKAKVVKRLNQLELKLRKARAKVQIMKLRKMIISERTRLKKINAMIEALPSAPVVQTKSTPKTAEKAVSMPSKKEAIYQVGGDAGLYAGLIGVRGMVVVKNPLNIMKGTTARIGAGYAMAGSGQTEVINNNRKFAYFFAGGSYNLDQIGLTIPGVDRTELVADVNYVNLTTGQFHGAIGGDAGLSIEKDFDPGIIYADLNYSLLRTGFSPSFKSIGLTLGYKLGFNF